MSQSRIYQAGVIELHQTLALNENASHHLARVLRAAIGDMLVVFNGDGYEYAAIITQIQKKTVIVEITAKTPRHNESPVKISLAQGIARGEKMDFIIQKAVELGVSHIFPLITERGNVRLTGEREEKRLQHWQSIIISASEQSGRTMVPSIAQPMTYAEWIKNTTTEIRFVLSPHVTQKLPNASTPPSSIALVIGPEGGLSNQEVDLAMQHNFSPLNLGPRILRTETATIAALSALQLRYGDFG